MDLVSRKRINSNFLLVQAFLDLGSCFFVEMLSLFCRLQIAYLTSFSFELTAKRDAEAVPHQLCCVPLYSHTIDLTSIRGSCIH